MLFQNAWSQLFVCDYNNVRKRNIIKSPAHLNSMQIFKFMNFLLLLRVHMEFLSWYSLFNAYQMYLLSLKVISLWIMAFNSSFKNCHQEWTTMTISGSQVQFSNRSNLLTLFHNCCKMNIALWVYVGSQTFRDHIYVGRESNLGAWSCFSGKGCCCCCCCWYKGGGNMTFIFENFTGMQNVCLIWYEGES